MPTPRASFSASVVDGRIYVIGGSEIEGKPLATVEVYDPRTDTWTRKADMPTARFHFATAVVDGKIYAIGGRTGFGGGKLSIVEEYDPVTDTWTQKADMPTARRGAATSAVDGKIYAIGGMGGHCSIVEEYDPVTDTWIRKADMPTGMSTSTSVVNGRVYAIGGYVGDERPLLPAVMEYDPDTDTWTKKPDMPIARDAATCALNGKIYVISGYQDPVGFDLLTKAVATVEAYDPETGAWARKADIPTARMSLRASAVDGRIYAIGGYEGFMKFPEFAVPIVEVYTPEGWIAVSPAGKLPVMWGGVKHICQELRSSL